MFFYMSPLRIIVADDDRDTVNGLKLILEDEGHVVQGLYDGKEVLPAVLRSRPDAIIMDLVIPGMSGYAVAQAVRHLYTDTTRPLLIAITGVWNEQPDRIIGRQVGFDHHILKPADPGQVVRLLEGIRKPAH
jgi:DNA-binding response OmpR family regulator